MVLRAKVTFCAKMMLCFSDTYPNYRIKNGYEKGVISYLVKESPTMFSKFKITDQGQNLLNFKCLTTTLSA